MLAVRLMAPSIKRGGGAGAMQNATFFSGLMGLKKVQ
jgi:hypothetical protein